MQLTKKSELAILFFSSLIFVLFLSNFVSAGPLEDVQSAINTVTKSLEPLFKYVLGSELSGTEFFFAGILIWIIIFSIIWIVLDRIDFFSDHRWVLWLISISASILSVRWIATKEIVQTIILPYSTLGIALSAGLPFVLYFLVVDVGFKGPQYRLIRRIAWIFFAVIFIGLWFSRYESISESGWIYPITALIALIMAFADGTISRFLLGLQMEKVGVQNKQDLIDDYKKKIADLPRLVVDGIITQAEADRRKKQYQKKLAWLHK